MQELAQYPHLGELRGFGDELFLARARAVDVDRREGALLSDAAIQMDFRIAGALELFENDIVHLRAGIDQRGGENGEASALFDIACRAEEPLRALQRIGVHAAREHLARAW